jgi:single-strand DNA-binding protein
VQTIIISGNLGKDAESKTTQKGDKVTSFSVGVKQGWGDNSSTNWYRCSVWGERGEKIAQYLTKGAKVFVTGELTIGSYEGKPQFDVRVNEIEWERRQSGEQRSADGSQGAPTGRPAHFDSNLDDDVPFISNDLALEYRVS